MNETQPKISIVIPTFNMARFLPECLSTISKQDYPNLEVIIIDGASTDDTQAVIEQYGYIVSRVVSERDHGQPDAVSKGLKLATGDIVHWHAADDIVLPGAFYRVVAEFKKHPEVDLIFSDGLGFTSSVITKGPIVRWVNFLDSVLFFGRFQSDCAYWRRAITYDVLPLDNNKQITCDEDFFLRMWVGHKYRWISQPLGAFRIHGDQVSQRLGSSTIETEREVSRRLIFEQLGWSETHVKVMRKKRAFSYWFWNRFAVKAYSGVRFALRKLTGDILRRRYSRFILEEWIKPVSQKTELNKPTTD